MFAKNFPEGRQGVLDGGEGEGGHTPNPAKQVFTQKNCFAKKSPEGATAIAGRQGVLKRGRKGGEVFPTFKKDGARSATQQSSFLLGTNPCEANRLIRIFTGTACIDHSQIIESGLHPAAFNAG